MPREYRGESSSCARVVQLFIDFGDLLPYGVQVIEDRAELPFDHVFRLACADRLLGRFQELLDLLGSDLFAACDAEEFPNLLGIPDQFAGASPIWRISFCAEGRKGLEKTPAYSGKMRSTRVWA